MIANQKLLSNFKPLKTEMRLHKIPTPIIAITGGIASGKSKVVEILKTLGHNILSADALIKEIYKTDEIKSFIHSTKPHCLINGEIDFKLLRIDTFNDLAFKEQLERLLYSKLPATFWDQYKKFSAAKFFFYEVPLLFEKKLQNLVDLVILVHTDRQNQLDRISIRDESNVETNKKILEAQLPFELKKDFAHFIIENNGTIDELQNQVIELNTKIKNIFI